MVQTAFDDWICIGGTQSAHCQVKRSARYSALIDDGKWHEIEIDVKSAVQEVLPSLRMIKSFQFQIDQNRYVVEKFWIDDFVIYKQQRD